MRPGSCRASGPSPRLPGQGPQSREEPESRALSAAEFIHGLVGISLYPNFTILPKVRPYRRGLLSVHLPYALANGRDTGILGGGKARPEGKEGLGARASCQLGRRGSFPPPFQAVSGDPSQLQALGAILAVPVSSMRPFLPPVYPQGYGVRGSHTSISPETSRGWLGVMCEPWGSLGTDHPERHKATYPPLTTDKPEATTTYAHPDTGS